jgi:hypothetical protein
LENGSLSIWMGEIQENGGDAGKIYGGEYGDICALWLRLVKVGLSLSYWRVRARVRASVRVRARVGVGVGVRVTLMIGISSKDEV